MVYFSDNCNHCFFQNGNQWIIDNGYDSIIDTHGHLWQYVFQKTSHTLKHQWPPNGPDTRLGHTQRYGCHGATADALITLLRSIWMMGR